MDILWLPTLEIVLEAPLEKESCWKHQGSVKVRWGLLDRGGKCVKSLEQQACVSFFPGKGLRIIWKIKGSERKTSRGEKNTIHGSGERKRSVRVSRFRIGRFPENVFNSTKPCMEREKRIQKEAVDKTLGEMSMPEADRKKVKERIIRPAETILPPRRQGREREASWRNQVAPHFMELKAESAKLSSLCLQCPH